MSAIVGLFFSAALVAQTYPPHTFGDLKLTPGALNPAVTVSNLTDTICSTKKDKNGFTWVHNQRPPASYTNVLVRKQLTDPRYGYTDKNPKHYEGDHVCSIEDGGYPGNAKEPNSKLAVNFRPEPYLCAKAGKPCKPKNCLTTPGAKCKDLLENAEHKMICVSHTMTPAQACAINAGNWLDAYKKYVSAKR